MDAHELKREYVLRGYENPKFFYAGKSISNTTQGEAPWDIVKTLSKCRYEPWKGEKERKKRLVRQRINVS